VDEALHAFYAALLELLRCEILRKGDWCLLTCLPAYEGDPTWNNFIAYSWRSSERSAGSEELANLNKPVLLVVVNYSPQPGRCRVQPGECQVPSNGSLTRLLASQPEGSSQWQDGGLSFDLPAWGYQVLQIDAGDRQ
jgi:hypothetical protein